MERVRFNLVRVEEEPNEELDACKLLGAPVMPAGFFDSLPLGEEDYFVAQIRCDAFPERPPFPKKGYLYLFVNINTLKPRAFYTMEEPAELIEDINASFDPEGCGDPTCLKMEFVEDGSHSLFGENDPDIGLESSTDLDGKLTLLELDAWEMPFVAQRPLMFGNFGMIEGHWAILIKEKDLEKGRFDRLELIETED